MQKMENLSVGISINKGCNAIYNPGERILISCSTTTDCVAEVQLIYPNKHSQALISNQVLRQGRNIVLERKVPGKSGAYTLMLYGRTPFGKCQSSCSFTCESVGSLLVESNINDAEVFVDNVYHGSSPAHIENIPVGAHEISVTKTGYHEWKSEIIVEEGLKTMVRALLTEVNGKHEKLCETGHIFVRSEPPEAEVYLDGVLRGTTPCLMENVSGGMHSIRVMKKDFHDFSQEVQVTPGKPTLISAILSRGHGSIQVLTSISGAEVYLDNDFEGNAPLSIYNVPEGSHVVALVKWGYEIWSSSVYVRAHEVVELHPHVSLLWIWYILATLGLPFYKLREALQNLRNKHELPPYVPEPSYSGVVVAPRGPPESEGTVLACSICNQQFQVLSNEILECLYCRKEGFSCQFHRKCWTKWLEKTHGQRKCILYPSFVGIPEQKIRVVKGG